MLNVTGDCMVEFKCTNQFFLHAEVFTVHNTEFSLDIERFLQAYKNVQFQEDPSAEKRKRNIIRTVC